jgi:hypothetical protein
MTPKLHNYSNKEFSLQHGTGEEINNAGIAGETEAFKKMLGIIGRLPLKIFHNKVIPYHGFSKEIDLICFGRKKIYIFEVKKMKGKIVGLNESIWQKKNGSKITECRSGFSQVSEARKAFVNYISEKCGVSKDSIEKITESKVLFIGDKFDPGKLKCECGKYLLENGLYSFIYLNELHGEEAELIETAYKVIEQTEGMHIIGLKNGVICRGKIKTPIFAYEINEKSGQHDYSVFLKNPKKLDSSSFVHIRFAHRKYSGFAVKIIMDPGSNMVKNAIISTPVIVIKRRGMNDQELLTSEIKYISRT